MKNIWLLICFIVSMSGLNLGQSKFGCRYEPYMLFAKNETNNLMLAYKEKTSFEPHPLSIYLSYKYLICENIYVNPRLGYLQTTESSEEFFSGSEIALIFQYNFWKDLNFSTGILMHYNSYSVYPKLTVYEGWIPFVLVGPEINLSEIFNIELNYLFPLKKQYGRVDIERKRNVLGMLKLSFGFEWEL